MALAISAERRGRTDEAKMIYDEIIKATPKRTDAHHRLALLHSRQGECEAAEEHYRNATQLEPGNAHLHCDRGYNYYLQEKWPEAEASFRRAIELDGELSRAHNNLGMLLARTGREAEAMQHFAKGGCDRAQASANLALAMAMEGRVEEAQQEYQRALEHNPKLEVARDMLASLQALPVNRQAGYVETSSPMPSGAVVPAWHHESPGPYPAPGELAR
jgi:Tfp pilus assembly protein PilF